MKTKRCLSLVIVGLLVVSVFGTVTGIGVDAEENDVGDASLSGGSVAEDAIEIYDWHDLNETRNNLSADYVLMNDLNESTEGYMDYNDPDTDGWEPIGDPEYGDRDQVPFTGTFDGNRYEIRDLYINRTDEDYIGLFGFTDDGAEINDLGVADSNVSGDRKVGGLVGDNSATVENSYYNIDKVLINGEHHVTIGGVFDTQYQDWIEYKNLDIENYSDSLEPAGEYYEISDVQGIQDLLGFAWNNDYKFRLADDIDLSGEEGLYIPYLGADFDGNGHTISDLQVDLPFVSGVGMFGYNHGGTVSDIELVNTNVSGGSDVGGLVGRNDGTVSNSYTAGNVSGDAYVGGFVGYNNKYTTIENSYATGNVSGGWDVGGLVGYNYGTVENSYATVNVSDYRYVGGLVGDNSGTIENSYATGNVSGDEKVGGLVGENDGGTVNNSYATGNVSGNEDVGGLIGRNYDTVSNSYATGNVSGDGFVGGLVGYNYEGTVSDSHATGNVSGSASGGLVGDNSGTVSDSYATGNVSGENYVGGLMGKNTDGTVSNSYATGNVSGSGYNVGGVVGGNIQGQVENSYATGNVGGEWSVGGLLGDNDGTVNASYAMGKVSGNQYVGGLVGWNEQGTVNNSYATGNVSGNSRVGGLIGKNGEQDSRGVNYSGIVIYSYAVGNVSGSSNVGGLIGENYEGTVTDSFWDIGTTGQDTSDGGTGNYTGRMVKKETFTDAGWDFEDTWDIIEEETYPFLQWQVEYNYPYSPELEEYGLTINIEGEGTVKVDGTEVEDGWTQEYLDGTDVDLQAIADEEWGFNKWEGTEKTGDQIAVTMNKDKEITANFLENYELTINIEGEGTVKVDGEEVEDGWTQEYEDGTEVTLTTAILDDEWEFDGWTGTDETGDEINITMDEDMEITANFEEEVVEEDDDGIPGFTTLLLLLASIIAVAIYRKKDQ